MVRSHIGQISVFPFPFEIELQAHHYKYDVNSIRVRRVSSPRVIQYFRVLISVGCALGPGVNTLKEGSTNFPFQTQFLQFV
jgi:hypothetical protein